MAKYLVAVSGGVDSVVLLDMLAKTNHTLIVAHVDHGIRGEESAADARFVAALAKQYQLPFVSTELGLGAKASEEQARNGRYTFLLSEGEKHGAIVVTAHHADDVVETIALNLTRGTGWRGLTVLDRADVVRPLVGLTKKQLYSYALKHRLEWVEDETNKEDRYLRNRLRRAVGGEKVDRPSLLVLRAKQLQLRDEIDYEVKRIADRSEDSRYFLSMLDESVAVEVLGAAIKTYAGMQPMRPQLIRALHAIKTATAGTRFQMGGGLELRFSARGYRIASTE